MKTYFCAKDKHRLKVMWDWAFQDYSRWITALPQLKNEVLERFSTFYLSPSGSIRSV
jgi:hypothetical protein